MTNSNRKQRVDLSQLAHDVSSEFSLPERQINLILEQFVSHLSSHLANGDSVTLSHYGLGRFDVVHAAPRVGRNVRTGESLLIPARLRVKFIPSLALKNIKGKKE